MFCYILALLFVSFPVLAGEVSMQIVTGKPTWNTFVTFNYWCITLESFTFGFRGAKKIVISFRSSAARVTSCSVKLASEVQ